MRFNILYPEAWQVRTDPQTDGITFYEDAPDGTGFSVVPSGYIAQAINGERFLQAVLQELREEFPDARITRQQVGPFGPQLGPPDLSEQGRAAFAWTDVRGLRWQAELFFTLSSNSLLRVTLISETHYQGPTHQWARLEPIFSRMRRSMQGGGVSLLGSSQGPGGF
jgi:hypothetical protein